MNFYGSVGREFKHLGDLAAHHRPQVMLCHFGSAALRLLPVAEKLGIPLVAHFHGQDVSSSLRNRWYRWSIIPALSRFAAVVVVGSHQRQWMLRHGVPEERVHLIPCGVPTEQFRPAGAQRTDGVVQFVAVSRLVAWKGVDYTLRAFAAVHAAVPQARLAIVGDGPDRRALEGWRGCKWPRRQVYRVLAPEQVRRNWPGRMCLHSTPDLHVRLVRRVSVSGGSGAMGLPRRDPFRNTDQVFTARQGFCGADVEPWPGHAHAGL